jgi:antitoxin ParD1/3/4
MDFSNMTITLTPELEKAVHRKVQSGLYHDASDVIREALRLSLSRDLDESLLRHEAHRGFEDLNQGRVFHANSLEEFIALVREAP